MDLHPIVVFAGTVFPLTYVLPLLICFWTRDQVALWSMAAIFAPLHTGWSASSRIATVRVLPGSTRTSRNRLSPK